MWRDVAVFVAVGFLAQLVDGAIGMAFGTSSTTALLTLGIAPAIASASVHSAEVFTTAASGLAHWRMGNIDFRLFRRLAVPGMIGGVAGAFFLANIPGSTIRPYVTAYLLVMGMVILWRAIRWRPVSTTAPRRLVPLGLVGGFLDAAGGGGWGPIVTSTLIGRGDTPRLVIGSVCLAEFFVALAVSGTFVFTVGLELWPIIAGLIIGGIMAAPLAAYTARRLPDRLLMVLVAVVIVLLTVRNLIQIAA
ncbi:MAG: sulfite exporter TauE/SafE family protein [Alphaproteobacteria bacterium]|nr:sulfite exporter TauE/SafE family protein [Alphaproteobacteria bacterium]